MNMNNMNPNTNSISSPRSERSPYDPVYYAGAPSVWEPPSRSSSLQTQPSAVPALLSSNPARASVDSSPRSSTNSASTIGMTRTKSTHSAASDSVSSFTQVSPALLNHQPFDQQVWLDYQQNSGRKISANHDKVRKFDQDRERVLEARRLYNQRLAEQAKQEERMKLELEKAKALEQAKVQAAVKQKSEEERRIQQQTAPESPALLECTHTCPQASSKRTANQLITQVNTAPTCRARRPRRAPSLPQTTFRGRALSTLAPGTFRPQTAGPSGPSRHLQRVPSSPQPRSFRDSDTVHGSFIADSPAPSATSSFYSDYAEKTPDTIDQEYIQTAIGNQSTTRYKSLARERVVAVHEHERERLVEARRLYNIQVAELQQRREASLSCDDGGVVRASVDVYVGPGRRAGVEVHGAKQHLSTTSAPGVTRLQNKLRGLFGFLGRERATGNTKKHHMQLPSLKSLLRSKTSASSLKSASSGSKSSGFKSSSANGRFSAGDSEQLVDIANSQYPPSQARSSTANDDHGMRYRTSSSSSSYSLDLTRRIDSTGSLASTAFDSAPIIGTAVIEPSTLNELLNSVACISGYIDKLNLSPDHTTAQWKPRFFVFGRDGNLYMFRSDRHSTALPVTFLPVSACVEFADSQDNRPILRLEGSGIGIDGQLVRRTWTLKFAKDGFDLWFSAIAQYLEAAQRSLGEINRFEFSGNHPGPRPQQADGVVPRQQKYQSMHLPQQSVAEHEYGGRKSTSSNGRG
ncbi:hypothetical protein HDU82_004147 [Entophlyctis luteolus]|nr:hypothetical protein HDU82_004147 [Entophlyctis luteolus]